MFALGLAFLALLVASVESHLGALGPKNVSQKDAEFEHTYVDEVNSELVNIYTFNHTVTRNRVRAEAGRGVPGGSATLLALLGGLMDQPPRWEPRGSLQTSPPLPGHRCSSARMAFEVVAFPSCGPPPFHGLGCGVSRPGCSGVAGCGGMSQMEKALPKQVPARPSPGRWVQDFPASKSAGLESGGWRR